MPESGYKVATGLLIIAVVGIVIALYVSSGIAWP